MPDFITFSCGGCGNKLKVKDEFSGKKVKCPKCNQVVLVPAAASSTAAVGGAAGGSPLDEKTRAPLDASNNLDAPTLPPANTGTVAPVSKADTNMSPPGPADDRSLTDFLAPPEQPDEIGRLGSYRVLKVLGAGGMGVVFKAEDPSLKRMVAIKAMLPAIAASASAKKRFLREAQAAAGINHTHIVTIHQVGEDRGIPFLAMQFLEGEPLDDRLKRETALPFAEVMRIGREMAEGMAAAHERGLIHRDIKPANTWLEGKKGHVKILDFGLARATDDQAHLTQSGAIIGTPAYMAPEQGRNEDLDARCDLWSLGVVLYRMSTGDVPFKGRDTVATLMAVALNNPPPPAKVNRDVPAGLSKLVMKLLEKDPAKRFASAQEVADALRGMEQSQQATQVIAGAGTTSVGQKLKSVGQKLFSAGKTIAKKPAVGQVANLPSEKAGRRPAPRPEAGKRRQRPWIAIAGALAAFAAIALGIVVLWPTPDGVIRIESDDPAVQVVFDKDGATIQGADKEPIRLRAGEHGVFIKRGDFEFKADNFEMKKGDKITLKIEFLQGKMQFLRDDKTFAEKSFPPLLAKNDPAKNETPPDLTKKKEDSPKDKTPPPGPLTASMVQKFEGHTAAVTGVALSGDGKNVLTGSYDNTAILWEAASGKKIQTFQGHTRVVWTVALSGDGKHVLTGSWDKTASLWDAASGKKIQAFQGHSNVVNNVFQGDSNVVNNVFQGDSNVIDSVALSGDGKLVLTGSLNTAILWDAPSGKKIQTFQADMGTFKCVALSGDGKLALTGLFGGGNTAAILWDVASGKKNQVFQGYTSFVNGVTLSGDGKQVLTGSNDGTAILWEAASGKKIQIFLGHSDVINSVALSGDGKLVLTGSDDKTAILWDAASGKNIQTFQGHTGRVLGVALSADGKRVLTGATDKTAILWEVKAAPPPVTPPPPPFVPLNLAEQEAKKLQEDWAAKLKLPVEATNKIGMKMMLIPPAGAALPEAYYLGKYEVTQGEWQQVMGYNPSHFGPQNAQVADASKFPVEQVSWYDAVEFCNKLSEQEGWKPYYQLTVTKRPGKQIEAAEVKILGGSGYHIPTEAEWEHGCLAGTKTLYHFGDKEADLPDYAWFDQNSQKRTHGAGEKKPNAFGLYDMHGNVSEWCEDQFPKGGPGRGLRSGGWNSVAGYCRAAYPHNTTPSRRLNDLGLRVARVASGPSTANKFKNSLGMEFALVPKGKSWLGGEKGKEGTKEVNIPQDFYLGVYEVTQEDWQKIMGKNPSHFNRENDDVKRFPVEMVSWEEVQAFVKLLNENEKVKQDGKEAGWEYRLPTEQQWEYACRGGPMIDKAESAFDFYLETPTNALSKEQANFDGSRVGRPRKVGSYPPNRLGLYDMHGNVWEWCEGDPGSPSRVGFQGVPGRASLGGSYGDRAEDCRAAQRNPYGLSYRLRHLGFRLARVPSPGK